MSRRLTHAEESARQTLETARAEFAELDERWDGYRVDVELIATLLYGLGVQRVAGLRAGERAYAAFLHADARLIAVESTHHEHRQRFSIAHEVGHFVLHVQPRNVGGGLYACSETDMEVSAARDRGDHLRREWEANLFAGELLMPEEPLLAMFRATRGRLSALARHFCVSPKALEIRLSRLDLPFAPS